MKKNILAFAGLVSVLCIPAMAQTSFDAARLYNTELTGTSRYVAMGGAMGALGSDVSVISQNPAGIGTYHQNDANVSFSLNGAESFSRYSYGNRGVSNGYTYYSDNIKSDFNGRLIENMSFVFCSDEGEGSYANFGFAFRRLQDTDCDMNYSDSFTDADGYKVTREFRDHSRNLTNAFDFNISWNLDDVMYLGANFEILSTDMQSSGYFYDYYAAGAHPSYTDRHDYTSVDKSNSSIGSGFNASFGMIARPVPFVRLGMAFKTPTWFKQNMVYEDNLYALRGEEKDGDRFETNEYYGFSSPWSFSLSAGLTAGKTAIGMEFERHFTGRSFLSIEDTRIEAQGAPQYRDFSTLRIGMEQNIDKLALRAGWCHNGSMFQKYATPYLLDTDFNNSRMDFQSVRPGRSDYLSFGLGYCSAPSEFGTQFYADMAFVRGSQKYDVCMNEYYEDPSLRSRYISNKVQLTVGWCF